MRGVIDTNVWVSGLLWTGPPWQILCLLEQKRIEAFATVSMLQELETVLHYPRLQSRRQELGLEIADLLAYATALVSLVELQRIDPVVLADPDDDVFVNCAVAVRAIYLISGNRHLLDLKQWQGILVVTPQAFLAQEFPHVELDMPRADEPT